MTLAELPARLSFLHWVLEFPVRRAVRAAPVPALSLRELDEAMRDSGLSAEDLLGERPDVAQPFFLRPGFGEGRR